jgi:hypothetical protein
MQSDAALDNGSHSAMDWQQTEQDMAGPEQVGGSCHILVLPRDPQQTYLWYSRQYLPS